uniref:15-hydroxyprostaglandin dehydrogenase [NAD(+)] n=1 Tax=Timema poppense TaxID=170557 RepID=A0A7R9D9E5_TIMPO|nr:unnamed protein product [Timema poppensis]
MFCRRSMAGLWRTASGLTKKGKYPLIGSNRALWLSSTLSKKARPNRQSGCKGGKREEIMDPDCKVAIVTGGATGIGYSAAYKLLKHGAKCVVISSRRKEKGVEAVEKLNGRFGKDKALFIQGDVNDEKHFRCLFEEAIGRYGQVDVLFNNAGMMNDKNWQLAVDTNLTSLIRGNFLAFEYMGKNNNHHGGIVVNNASIVGLQTLHGAPVYSATKFGVIGVTRNLGHEYHFRYWYFTRSSIGSGTSPGVLQVLVLHQEFYRFWYFTRSYIGVLQVLVFHQEYYSYWYFDTMFPSGTVKVIRLKLYVALSQTGIRIVALCPGVTDTVLVTGARGKQYNPDWGKEAERLLSSLPGQPTSVTGLAFVDLVRYAPSGTIWVVENSQLLRADIPDRHSYSTVAAKYK